MTDRSKTSDRNSAMTSARLDSNPFATAGSVEKCAGDDFLREFLSCALHKVMEAEVGDLAGEPAGYERGARRARGHTQ